MINGFRTYTAGFIWDNFEGSIAGHILPGDTPGFLMGFIRSTMYWYETALDLYELSQPGHAIDGYYSPGGVVVKERKEQNQKRKSRIFL